LEDLSDGRPMTAGKLATGLARAEGLSMDIAELRAAQVVQLCGFDEGEALSPDEFVRGLTAVDLGKFTELGMGGGLSSTAQAGAKFYEGGPYTGQPLDVSKLKENMMVIDGIEGVMEHVGCSEGVQHQTADWARMWPCGVFLCNFQFEEKPL